MKKCLKKLVDELWHKQYGLDPEVCIDGFIHNKFINICQNISLRQYAYFKPADSLAGLINNLFFSIIIYIQSNPISNGFFTDRQ